MLPVKKRERVIVLHVVGLWAGFVLCLKITPSFLSPFPVVHANIDRLQNELLAAVGPLKEVAISKKIPSIPEVLATSHGPAMSSGCSVGTCASPCTALKSKLAERMRMRLSRNIDTPLV